jgi:hypothetical protein
MMCCSFHFGDPDDGRTARHPTTIAAILLSRHPVARFEHQEFVDRGGRERHSFDYSAYFATFRCRERGAPKIIKFQAIEAFVQFLRAVRVVIKSHVQVINQTGELCQQD